jgi:uncharacterized protein YaiL (DUF2058 family)
MGNSLRDELLKVGLVSEERLEKPRRPNRGKARPGKKRKESSIRPPIEQTIAPARQVLRENQRRTARFVRDATLGGGSVAESAKKALRRKIQELVQTEQLNDAAADVPYHFVKGKRVKRIYVTQDQRAQLTAGSIVIAALEGNHHLLTRSAAERLLSLAPQTVVCGGAEAAGGDGSSGGADGDEHPVPDDITW